MAIADGTCSLSRTLEVAGVTFETRLALASGTTTSHATGTLVRANVQIGASARACKGTGSTKETLLASTLCFLCVWIELALTVALARRDSWTLGGTGWAHKAGLTCACAIFLVAGSMSTAYLAVGIHRARRLTTSPSKAFGALAYSPITLEIDDGFGFCRCSSLVRGLQKLPG